MAQIDVIIPAYNPGPYLRDTLDSVIAQSLPDWNAVVIDDGSTEDLTWVDSFDPRVRRLRQANAGLSAARNKGIEQGTSRFVAFLDADDIWLPDKLSEQLAALENSDAVLCSTAFDMIDSTGKWLGPGYEGHAASYAELLAANGICVSTVMVPRAALDRVGLFSSAYQQVQDWDLWLRLARQGRIIKLAKKLARYRQHGASMSLNYLTMFRESTTILRTHERDLRSEGCDDMARIPRRGRGTVKRLAGIQAFDALRITLRSNPGRGLVHFGRALQLAPRYTIRSVATWLWNRVRAELRSVRS